MSDVTISTESSQIIFAKLPCEYITRSKNKAERNQDKESNLHRLNKEYLLIFLVIGQRQSYNGELQEPEL